MSYKPKYLFRKTPAKRIQITDRDLVILRNAWRFRLISTDHIIFLTKYTGKSKSKINDRLRELFDHKYLDRPPVQDRFFSHASKRPLIHALGNEGAKLLKQIDNAPIPSSVNMRVKNEGLKGEQFFLHTLGVTNFYMHMQMAVAKHNNVQLADQTNIIARSPSATQRMSFPLTFETKFRWIDGTRLEHATISDGLLALHDQISERPQKSFFFLEYDRATELVIHKGKKQSSIVQKMLGYGDIYNREMHKKRFGYNNFRVLFVVPSRDRIDNIITAYNSHVTNNIIGAGAFLFATEQDVIDHSPLADIWVTADGSPVKLIPSL